MSRTDAILKRLLALHPKIIDLSLDRVHRLLAALDHPERRMAPVIHVAGTNGKGSTVAFLRAMLEADGKRVHVYTSPHLVAFRERIRLAGKLVSARRLNDALERCEAANMGAPITFFEITTAAALLLFAETEADYVLLEVGLGGRLDATNVIDHPLASVITPVSIDHVQYLGDTLGLIAGEKAGILKRGAPAIIARQPDEAMAAIETRARGLGIAPFVCGQDFDAYAQNGRLVYFDDKGLLDLPLPRLTGAHQIENAGLAIATLRHLGLPASPDAIETGLRTVQWPARLQHLKTGALTALIAPDQDLWLDGGHNAAGARVLADALAAMQKRHKAPLVLIVGMLSTKDARAFFETFRGQAHKAFTVRIPGEAAALSARDLASLARAAGLDASPARSLKQALQSAAGTPGARIVICGSLYLAGHVLSQNKTPPA